MNLENGLDNDLLTATHSAARMRGDERRDQILATAISLFSRNGFRGTTTKEIAKAAGVSEAMVFRHFDTKEALYGAILDDKACREDVGKFAWENNAALQDAIAAGDDFAVFYNIALSTLEKHQLNESFLRLIFFSALEEHELAARFFSDFVERVYDFIGNYIHRRQVEGAFRDIEPRTAVRAFLGMLIHHSLNNILWDKERRVLNISNEDAAKSFAEVLLHGIEKKHE